jgi:hypothetical protein
MRKQFLLVLIVVSFFVSCKKESTNQPPANPGGGSTTVSKIKEWTNNSGMTTYTYDASGRCTQYLYSSGAKNTFEFLSNKIIQRQFNNAGINDFTREYEVGANGLVSKETRPNDPNFDAVFIYNSDKQVVKKIYHQNGSTQTVDYFFSNGNCDSARFSTNNIWSSTTRFTYYTDKPNTISNDAFGMQFFGKDSKNLLKSEQYVYSDGTQVGPIVRVYEFDAAGKVIKQTSQSGANINITYISYY